MSFTLDDDDDPLDGVEKETLTPPSAGQKKIPDFSIDDFVREPDTPNSPEKTRDTAGNASFNIDEFLTSPDMKSVEVAAPVVSPLTGMESFSIDDFLGDSIKPVDVQDRPAIKDLSPFDISTTTSSADKEPSMAPVIENQSLVAADDDFLSWLDDDTKAQRTETRPPTSTTKPVTSVAAAKHDVAPASAISQGALKSQKSSKYESELLRLITSSFPDVTKLQSLIASNGYIPRELRGQIWCLLLSGTCAEDQEADFWQSTGLELPNHADVRSDSEAIIEKCRKQGLSLSASAFDQIKKDLVDILVLYCVRRTIPYKSLYCDLLAPMIVTSKPLSRTVASSCFYSLCSEFIPVVNLPAIQQDKVSEKLHSLLRLLLMYHSPKLTIHLDRVIPGWEQRTSSISAAMAIKYDAAVRDRKEIDELERDFGVSLPDEASNCGRGSGADQLIDSSRGRIPENWLYCVFGVALPQELSCWIWDWVLSSGDKYTGLYLVVALFALYSDSFRGMSGAQISEWIDVIAAGSSDCWFQQLPISMPNDLGGSAAVSTLTWESFVRGWVHAAEAIRHATPTSFQMSLNNIEKWGSESLSEVINTNTAGLDSSTGSDATSGLDRSGTRADVAPLQTGSSHGSGSSLIIERLRRISVQMQKPPEGSLASEGLRGRFSRALGGNTSVDGSVVSRSDGEIPGHATPFLSERCLWANVAEVVPCLCSSSKQCHAIPADKKMFISFKSGAAWGVIPNAAPPTRENANTQNHSRSNSISSQDSADGVGPGDSDRGGEGFVIPLIASTKDKPFFFGIDCRAADNEISLGKFPKAYNLDPADLKDSYMTSTILRTLEPMANQFHFCIIGVGEEFFAHRAAALACKAGKGRALVKAPTVETLRTEYFQGVAEVIDFFQKRNFKNVSFLEGGVTSAIRFLMKDDCPFSVSSSLVDVEADTLDTVFGQGSASAHLSIRRGVSTHLPNISGGCCADGIVTSGSSSFLASLAKADIFASGSNNDGDVVEVSAPQNKPASSGSGGLLSFMSKKVSTAGVPVSSDTAANITSDNTASRSAIASSAPSGERLGELKSKMSLFGSSTMASLRRVSQSAGSGTSIVAPVGTSSGVTFDDNNKSGDPVARAERKIDQESSSAFVIDDDEEDGEGTTPDGGPVTAPTIASGIKSTFITRVGGVIRSSGIGNVSTETNIVGTGSIARLQGGGLVDVDSNKIGVSKTEAEKAQALAMHKLAGLVKGDQITINRESLPGALLFPARKIKMVPVSVTPPLAGKEDATVFPDDTPLSPEGAPEVVTEAKQFHRYIVVTKERVIVLDSGGGGVGSVSTVKSNHHLTEFVKLTFKKRDPELLTLFVANAMTPDEDMDETGLDEKQRGGAKQTVKPKQKLYRVTKRDELVEILQKYMKRFK